MPSFVDRFIFQPPYPPNYTSCDYPAELCLLNDVVCLGLPNYVASSHVLIFFHGNAEDLGNVYNLMKLFRDRLGIHIIALEYPGYGISYSKPSTDSINDAANQVFSYVHQKLCWPSNRIIICGRSIGTGPATKLAAEKEVAALLLVSPYRCLKSVAQNMAGCLGAMAVSTRWNTQETVKHVRCPTLFLHGREDNIIPSHHSEILYNECQASASVKRLRIIDGLGHNEMNWPFLIQCMKEFLTNSVLNSGLEKRPLILHDAFFQEFPSLIEPGKAEAACNRCWYITMYSSCIQRLFNSR